MGKSATKLGATVLLFAGVACTYAATEAVLEGFRGKGDWKNGAVGGLLAGLHYCFALPICTLTHSHAEAPLAAAVDPLTLQGAKCSAACMAGCEQQQACAESLLIDTECIALCGTGSLFGLRAGSIHTAATSGLLLSAVSISGDIMNGQLRTNIFSDDPRPSNPYATKLSLPKA